MSKKRFSLKPEFVPEVNQLLRDHRLPEHRRFVTVNGANVQWLRKHLPETASDRLKALLGLTEA